MSIDLRERAEEFGERIAELLNATIADQAALSARVNPDSVFLHFGPPESLKPGTFPIGLRSGGIAHLLVLFDLRLDDEREHLAVRKSTVGLYMLDGRREPLFRYEYEREKGRYAPAHLHVHGQSHALGRLYALAGRLDTADLHDVRFPVGGRRYRPSVEDVIELLLDYNLVDAKPGARERVVAERDRFHRIQLKAAVRRDPEAALEALRESGAIRDQ